MKGDYKSFDFKSGVKYRTLKRLVILNSEISYGFDVLSLCPRLKKIIP